MKDVAADGSLDLSSKLILLPTSEAVRRLREALALRVSESQGALVAPHLKTTDSVLWGEEERNGVSTSLQDQFAWDRALAQVALSDFPNLFPVPPSEEMLGSWRKQTARALKDLKSLLAAGGYRIGDIVERMSQTPDAERWEDLAKLEKAFENTLENLEVKYPLSVRVESAQHPQLPEGVDVVILMGVFEMTPLFRTWLIHLSEQRDLFCFVYADESYSSRFDEYGVPLLDSWTEATAPHFELREDQFQVVKEPKVEAEEALNWALKKVESMEVSAPFSFAFGATHSELNPFVESHLVAQGLRAFDPSGKIACHHSLYKLLDLWSNFLQKRYWKDLCVFLRHPDVLQALRKEFKCSEAELLRHLDEMTCDKLPTTLDQAIQIYHEETVLRSLLKRVEGWVQFWQDKSLKSALLSFLNQLYGNRTFVTSHAYDKQYIGLTGKLMDSAEEIDQCIEQLKTEDMASRLIDVLLNEVRSEPLEEVRGQIDFTLYGWLELLWEPSSHVAVLGMNEEYLPGVLKGDVFLPDAERRRLGLSNQKSRRARDAYLLYSILEQRREKGDFLLLLSRQNAAGEGLKPSRLFFDVDDASLVDRVKWLFPKEAEDAISPEPASSVGFPLRPRWQDRESKSISASTLNDYLMCPFRYYLKYHLKMKAVETDAQDLDAASFGNLLHLALKDYALVEEFQQVVETEKVGAWLEQRIRAIWIENYGNEPLATLILQLESAKQRLWFAANELCRLRAEGWVTEATEFEIGSWEVFIEDRQVFGKIDRLDKRVVNGQTEYLIIDYKTGAPSTPDKTHLRSAKSTEEIFEEDGWRMCGDRFWKGLQLPLYAWCLKEKYPDASISLAYFNLPATKSDVGIKEWVGFGDAEMESAIECVKEVIHRLKHRVFWPANAEVKYDDFEFLLGDPELTIDPTELQLAQQNFKS